MEGIHRFKVGSITCTAIADSLSELTAEKVEARYPAVPREALLAAFSAYAGDAGVIRSSLTCLLIETGSRVILADTGMGPENRPEQGWLHDGVAQVADPTAVDTVLITHAHGDHINGLVDENGALMYPNASYLMARAEWEHWMGAGGVAERDADYGAFLKRKLEPIRGRLTLLDDEGEIAPGVRTVLLPGHTPGHLGLLIESEGDALLDYVDALHAPFQLEHPGWPIRFDTNPEMAAETRHVMLARAADDNLLTLGYHLPFPGLGRMVRAGNAFRWEPATR